MGFGEHHFGAHTILCPYSGNKDSSIGYTYNAIIENNRKLFCGAKVTINISEEYCDVYRDIANFNQYDMIISTPFIREHKVQLDFINN